MSQADRVRSLIEQVKSGSVDDRVNAATELRELGSAAAPAVPTLIEALRDKE